MFLCGLCHVTLTEKCPLVKIDRYFHGREDGKGAGRETRAGASVSLCDLGQITLTRSHILYPQNAVITTPIVRIIWDNFAGSRCSINLSCFLPLFPSLYPTGLQNWCSSHNVNIKVCFAACKILTLCSPKRQTKRGSVVLFVFGHRDKSREGSCSKETKIINLVIDLGSWWLSQCRRWGHRTRPATAGQGLLEIQGPSQRSTNHRAENRRVAADAQHPWLVGWIASSLAFSYSIFWWTCWPRRMHSSVYSLGTKQTTLQLNHWWIKSYFSNINKRPLPNSYEEKKARGNRDFFNIGSKEKILQPLPTD